MATKKDTIYIARETFTTVLADGTEHVVTRGVTRVRHGHELLKGREQMFEELDVHYDVEDASADPGRKRGEDDAEPAKSSTTRSSSRKS